MKISNRAAPLLALLCLMVEPTPAFAYLDPSTGSMVISAVVGILASLVLAIKTYWYRITRLFKHRRHDPKQADTDSTTAHEEPPR